MKRQTGLLLIIFHFLFTPAGAQTAFSPAGAQGQWTLQQCMQYAVAHNHDVRRAELELDNYKASRTGAVGRFLPEVDAGVGVQYNFGRAIDPETNGYTDVSTFYNGYSVQATLPVFDGFSRLHALRAAKASVLMGREALRVQQDQTALAVLQAFANVAYCEEMVRMAEEKVQEATLLLRQTRLLEEVGRKSLADVAQVEAQQAEADYELTHQQHLRASAMLELKQAMAFPVADSITCDAGLLMGDVSHDGNSPLPRWEFSSPTLGKIRSHDGKIVTCGDGHPELRAARLQMQVSRHEWCQARAALLPSLSLSAGLSTTYYHTLHTPQSASFSSQFRNNMGEYVGATLSIPLFNRLQTQTGIRRAKNNYLMAREAFEQKQQEIDKLALEAWQDYEGYRKQAAQMERKVQADSLAYQLVRRQFEEGLSTAIDVRTTSAQLLQSRATLLQCRLMAMVKEQLVRYYNGETIWTE